MSEKIYSPKEAAERRYRRDNARRLNEERTKQFKSVKIPDPRREQERKRIKLKPKDIPYDYETD